MHRWRKRRAARESMGIAKGLKRNRARGRKGAKGGERERGWKNITCWTAKEASGARLERDGDRGELKGERSGAKGEGKERSGRDGERQRRMTRRERERGGGRGTDRSRMA